MLMVPSAAMGRDIPVAFQGGGPHAVVLLDAFNAAPDVSNWVTAGNAMNTLAGKGISVAAPAGGAWSMYTNWEQDGSRQWETFLADELPDWLAANKGLAPGGHGIVGAAQGGTGALTWRRSIPTATASPARCRASWPRRAPASTAPSPPGWPSSAASTPATCGVCHSWAGGSGTTPNVHVQLLADNNTRLWVFSPSTAGCSDPAAMIGYCDRPRARNRTFYQHYRSVGGHNGHFDFPTGGNHDWGTWQRQLAAMSGELVATIK